MCSSDLSLGIGLLATALAVVGYDWIHAAQRLLAGLLLTALLVMTFALGRAHFPPEQLDIHRFAMIPFLVQLFVTAAYQLSWSIYVSDYSRYLPKEVSVGSAFFWTYVGAFIGGAWTTLVGTVAAAMFPKDDLAPALLHAANAILPGSGEPLLIVTLLGLVTITTLNYYGASLTMLSVADSLKPIKPSISKRLVTLAIGFGVSTLIASSASKDFAHEFGEFLAILLYLFTPWTAVNLVDFYIVRKGHYSVREIFNPNGMYGRWNWRGLTAYFIGFLSMVPFFSTGIYRGPVAEALGGADISMLVGLPVSTVVYLLACRGVDFEEEARRAAKADEGLDGEA